MEEAKRKKVRKRSPGYPVISLKEAIKKANILWDKDQKNQIHKEVACKHLSYESTGGYAGRVIAALKQYGLITEKNNDIMLTKDAVDLFLYKPNDQAYIDIIKKLSIKPPIYNRLYNENNGHLLSDDALRAKLIRDYDFNVGKVDRFINDFRETIEFSGLTENQPILGADMTNSQDTSLPPIHGHISQPNSQTGTGLQSPVAVALRNLQNSFPIRLKNQNQVVISFNQLPVDDSDLQLIKNWIDLMKESLIEKPSLESNSKE